METGELIFIGFCSLAAINALFFAGYLWFRREKSFYPSLFLSLFLVITACRIVQVLLHDVQEDFSLGINLRTLFFFIPTFPLPGPLLFLYIKSLVDKDFSLRPAHLLHLLPFMIVLVTDLINRDNLLRPSFDKSFYTFYCVEISLVLIQFLTYIVISLKLLAKAAGSGEIVIKNNVDIFPIRTIIALVSVVWLIYLFYCMQIYIREYLPTRVFEALFYSILSYMILYTQLRAKRIGPADRYKTSALTAEDAGRYKSVILELMRKEKLYQDHNITLAKFSRALSLKPHVVSQVINEQLSCNFNDFINSFRVEEAKVKLLDSSLKNYTIASIAYDCGFNTLSAFNTAFKKFTGKTPSRFRNGE